jgi:hypothetical protein
MRLTKPPKDNPHAVFKYGVECGIDQERDRIISLLESVPDMGASDWADGYHEAIAETIALIKGESK